MEQHLTVKDLPESEKPYEKCLHAGAAALSDAELLAAIIRTGTAGRKSLDVAQDLLSRGEKGIRNLQMLSIQELLDIPGIGEVKAVQIKCLAEISRRMAQATRKRDICLNSAASVAAYYMEELRYEEREKLVLCMFDAQCVLLGDEVISVGTVNASLVSPREVFKHYKELEEVGLAAPQVTYIMHDLKARGADVDVDATTIEEAAEEIARVWKQNNQK